MYDSSYSILRRPKGLEQAVDSREFTAALREMVPYLQERWDTPREMRRFLNYLRVLAARDDFSQRPTGEGFEARTGGISLREGQKGALTSIQRWLNSYLSAVRHAWARSGHFPSQGRNWCRA